MTTRASNLLAALCVGLYLLAGCVHRSAAALGQKVAAAAVAPPGGSDLSHVLLWAIVACLAGIAASAAALVWLPTKKAALAALAGFVSTLAVSVALKVAQPWLGWFVLGVALVGVVGGVYEAWRIRLVQRLEAELPSVPAGDAPTLAK